jgi:DNA-binding transcriptional MerR regulator
MTHFKIKRLYYTVHGVREIVQISSYTLRNWESRFPVLRPVKNKSGRRLFRQRDLDFILRIKKWIEAGYTDEKIREMLQSPVPKNRLDSEIGQKKLYKRAFMNAIYQDLEAILKILNDQ